MIKTTTKVPMIEKDTHVEIISVENESRSVENESKEESYDMSAGPKNVPLKRTLNKSNSAPKQKKPKSPPRNNLYKKAI